MIDQELAREIVERLNRLIQDHRIREDIGKLIAARVPCCETTADHPTIQAHAADGKVPELFQQLLGAPAAALFEDKMYKGPMIGFLGVLNGLVGVIPEGKMAGWGYISAVYDDAGHLDHFRLTP